MAHMGMEKLFVEAGRHAIAEGRTSIGTVQRQFRVGFNRGSYVINQLLEENVIGLDDDREDIFIPRMSIDDFEEYVSSRETEIQEPLAEIPAEERKRFFEKVQEMLLVPIQSADYDSMTGIEFENFCADLLRKNGFNDVSVTPGSGDHGIDVLAQKDDIQYAIQCKCYSANVGNQAVQEAFSGKRIYDADIAVVLTNSYFTEQAITDAKNLKVKLWDRDYLQKLIEMG